MDFSNHGTPSGEQFSAALSAFVKNFGVVPPSTAYLWHAAYRPFYNAVIARRCVLGQHWAAGTAVNLVRSTVQADGVLSIEGYSSAKQARDDVQERVKQIRTDPMSRRTRGMMWRYWQREKLLIADILDTNQTTCPYAAKIQQALVSNYVPDIKDLGGNIDWTR